MGYNPGVMLLSAIAKEAQRHLQEYNLQELADMIWAFAQLGDASPADIDKLLDTIPDVLSQQLQKALKVEHW